jgi:hypothetical protein
MSSLPPTPSLTAAFSRVAEAYERLPEDQWPDVLGPEWTKREDAIDAAYVARDPQTFKAAVVEWERFALEKLATETTE